jgi:sporulation protein YqfC
MRKWIDNLKRKTAEALDLPSDVITDLPRLTVIGFVQLYIENHHGVLLFNDQELRLLLKKGQLIIKGRDLTIRTILSEELFVEGTIHQIQVIE